MSGFEKCSIGIYESAFPEEQCETSKCQKFEKGRYDSERFWVRCYHFNISEDKDADLWRFFDSSKCDINELKKSDFPDSVCKVCPRCETNTKDSDNLWSKCSYFRKSHT